MFLVTPPPIGQIKGRFRSILSENSIKVGEDPPYPIDIVYTWVNGRDPVWKEQFAEAKSKQAIRLTKIATERRYSDLDELKYSLRSIESYIPWYNTVHIVTANQYPDWIIMDHPKLNFVNHSTIFPSHAPLPNFNSYAIESVIHHIPGLADHYIYFNDDMFIGRPLPFTFFFTPDGKPKNLFSPKNWTRIPEQLINASKHRRKNDMAGIQFGFVMLHTTALCESFFKKEQHGEYVHAPTSMSKKILFEIEKNFYEEMNYTACSQFRDYKNVLIQQFVYLYGKGTGLGLPVPKTDTNSHFYIVAKLKLLNLLYNSTTTDTFCVNTDMPRFNSKVQAWLEGKFPIKSSFEKLESTS